MALVMMPGGEMQDLARRYANTVRPLQRLGSLSLHVA